MASNSSRKPPHEFSNTRSLWAATADHSHFPALKGPLTVEVAVIGAGITGITAAWQLKRAGMKVAVIDQGLVGAGETGRTTAHLTELVDGRYDKLHSTFGKAGARLVAESSRAAIDYIAAQTHDLGIDCGFQRVPAYFYTEDNEKIGALKREWQAARDAGLAADWVAPAGGSGSIGLPFFVRGAVKLENQAQFHPLLYLHALAREIPGEGCHVFENSRMLDIHDGEPCRIEVAGGQIIADDVIVATNTPVSNRLFIHTKLAAYRTYALGLQMNDARPLGGLFWDSEDPYHYLRSQRIPKEPGHEDGRGEAEILIVGGEDHKVGMEADTEARFEKLEQYARARFDLASVRYRWSGQIIEPVDGLPYIGKNSISDHVFVATGFSGNGMTFGTIAGLLLSDLILGRENAWSGLYRATRVHPLSSALAYVEENKDFPLCMIGDRISHPTAMTLDQVRALPRGDGRVTEIDGKKTAVFVDSDGTVRAFSPVCPHLGCHVHWNGAEKSFDCPCHGSRFSGKGEVLNGPSMRDLQPVQLNAGKTDKDTEAA